MNFESNAGPNYQILAQRFMSCQQWDRSLGVAMEWLGKEPENARAHRVAAQSLVNLNRTPEAARHLQIVLAGNPKDDFAHRLMAIVYSEMGAFKAAEESARKAIELNPQEAYHWYQLGHIAYRQRDLVTAKRCVGRARELSPRDADILNLAILCEAQSPQPENIIEKYEQALALDPENANIYNNMGLHYLNRLKDYRKADEYFRRALFFEPSSALIRRNLFAAVKQLDVVYRILRAPRDWLYEGINLFRRARKRSLLLYILMIPLWLLAIRFIIGGLALWFAFVWPLTKVYEFLTIGDIRARTGELGVRRGGFLGYRKWPLKVRLSIFGVILVSFWGGVAFLVWGNASPADKSLGWEALGIVFFVVLFICLGYQLSRRIRNRLQAWAAHRRGNQLERSFRSKREGEA